MHDAPIPNPIRRRSPAVLALWVVLHAYPAHAGPDEGADGTQAEAPAPPVAAQRARPEDIEEIVVPGSYIRRRSSDFASPVSVIDRQSILQTGAFDLGEVTSDQSFSSGSITRGSTFGGEGAEGATSVNLRNLGLGSTLVLLNGKRNIASFFDGFGNAAVDTSILVPTIAVQRFEVVKDGTSALYGSDAIAGSVDLRTRRSFEGFELQLDVATDDQTRKQDDLSLGGIWGRAFDRGHLVAALQYVKRDPLHLNDRFGDFGRSGVSTIGQPGRFALAPGSVLVDAGTGAALLDGTGAPRRSLPGGNADLECDVAASVDPRAVAGRLGPDICVYDFSSFFAIVGEEEQKKLYLSGRWELDDSLLLYGEVALSENDFSRFSSATPDVTTTLIPVSNPGLQNDARRRGIEPVPLLSLSRAVGGALETPNSLRPVVTENDYGRQLGRFQGGFEKSFSFLRRAWTLDVSLTRSRRRLVVDLQNDTLREEYENALGGLGGSACDGNPGSGNLRLAGQPFAGNGQCFFFNPFGSGVFAEDGSPQQDPLLANPPELLQSLIADTRSRTTGTQSVVDVVATGELFDLPAGPVGLALGLQYRRDRIDAKFSDDLRRNNLLFGFGAQEFSGDLTTRSLFAETLIPLHETLEASLAVRWESFSEIDEDSIDPKATLLWRPVDGLSIRGSYGTSFRVGSLEQILGERTIVANSNDAFSGLSGLAFRPSIASGNPELAPEEAVTFSLGFSVEPFDGFLEGLTLDADYYSYHYTDIITRLGHQELIDLDNASRCPDGVNTDPAAGALCGVQPDGSIVSIGPGLPDAVIRNAVGGLLRTQADYVNAQKLDTSGLDVTLAYEFDWARLGRVRAAVSGSQTLTYDLVNAVGEKIDGVGSRNDANTVGRPLPEFKAHATLSWQRGDHAALIRWSWVDGYEDDRPQDPVRSAFFGEHPSIDAFSTIDLQYRMPVPLVGEGSMLTMGIKNLFDAEPPKVNTDSGFDPTSHDPRGRIFYLRYALTVD